MADSCPDINSSEWKLLVNQTGENLAWLTWYAYGNDYPSTLMVDSKLRRSVKIPYKLNINSLPRLYKSIARYNSKNGTSHKIFKKQIGESELYELELKVNYLPVNQELKRLREAERNEDNITQAIALDTSLQSYLNVGNDFYMGDNALKEQEDKNYLFSPKEKTPQEEKIAFIINRLEEKLKKKENELANVKRTAKKLGNFKAIGEIEDQIKRIEETVAELKTEATLNNIADRANIELDYVQKLLSKKGESLTGDEIQSSFQIIKLWRNIQSTDDGILTEDDFIPRIYHIADKDVSILPAPTQNIVNLGARVERIAAQLDSLNRKRITETAKRLDENVTEKSLFKKVKDISKMNLLFRDASNSGVLLLDLLSSIRRLAGRKATSANQTSQQKRKEELERLKKSPLYQRLGHNKFMEMLWQEHEGKKTGGLIQQYSVKYWKERSKYWKGIKSNDADTFKKAATWYNKVHEFVNYFETEEEKLAEIERLSKEFGTIRAEQLVDNMSSLFEDYRLRKEDEFERIDDLEITDREYRKEIWLIRNDPKIVLKNLKAGKLITNKYGKTIVPNFEYIDFIPKENEEWYDSSFETLQKDEIALEYYNYVKNTLEEGLSNFDTYMLNSKGINGRNFIPNVRKKIYQRVRENGLSALADGAKDFRNIYSIQTYSKTSAHLDPETGAIMETLDIRMLAPEYKTTENGRFVETKDLVVDLDIILQEFLPVTLNYKFMKSVEPDFLSVKEAANKLQGIQKTPSGIDITNKNEENLADETKLKNLKEAIQQEYNLFYGKNKLKEESASSKKRLSKIEKKQDAQIKARIKEINTQLETATEEETEAFIKEKNQLERKQSDLGRNISGTKALKSTLRYYQLISQGWNIGSASIELLYGMISNYINASGNKDYSFKHLKRAWRITLENISTQGSSPTSKKLEFLMEKYQVLGEVMDYTAQNDIQLYQNKIKSKLGPYGMMRAADKFSKGSVMVSILMNTNLEGNPLQKDEISLWEAYDKEGNLKEEHQDKAMDWLPSLDSSKSNKFWKLQDRITQVIARNHGRYEFDAPPKVLNNALGMAALQFRRWMVEGFIVRFESEREDTRLGRTVKGRYRTYVDLVNKKGAIPTLSLMLRATTQKLLFSPLTEEKMIELGVEEGVDRENVQKNAGGLIALIMLYMVVLMLKGFNDDDDEKFGVTKFLLNQGGRLQQDLTFYTSPNTFADLSGSILPVMRLTDSVAQWGEAVWQTAFETNKDYNTIYQRGEFKGEYKALIKTGTLLPGAAAGIKFYRMGSKIFE